ncbi:oxidoreductase [Photobacterium swingsii]|uniref:Gfo/Idh/MocA family oxidoreductase n=1 Tax=Photobacterium swingsii TaxID=680026 RepID=A0A0J8VGM9_9GAMM|nr:Gfo/Idh/MocA family oxidoreductase [Photobacterium swingsii]KMV32297.1 oxidoreductase [Photobacterium swingsii]PSW27131.1 gfo/Idh/MocA family oxidoreductase [Photobacterium swingsii]
MIKFAVVGTNWITDAFIEGAIASGKMQLTAVYSRTMEKAEEFASKYQDVTCFDDIKVLASSDCIDAVYIASPNSLHAEQAALFIKEGKHVIGEKPLASNITQVEHLVELAKQHQVVLFEAMKAPYTPNFSALQKALPKIGKLRKVHLTYCQYSSRYQKYLNGENPNTFNPAFSNGSLMDIGIYPLSAAVALFGEPNSFTAQGTLLDSGVDAHGTLVLHYQDFDVTIAHSKVSDGVIPSEFQGEQGTITVKGISECLAVDLYRKDEPVLALSRDQVPNTMQYEAEVFAELVANKTILHDGLNRSRIVSNIITHARGVIGVRFPADDM